MRRVSHDFHWQAAALVIEQISGLKSVFGWQLNMNRMGSVASDFLGGRADVPNEAILREPKINIEEIKSTLQDKKKGSGFKRDFSANKTLKTNICIREEAIEP
jgi:hypothetical protein